MFHLYIVIKPQNIILFADAYMEIQTGNGIEGMRASLVSPQINGPIGKSCMKFKYYAKLPETTMSQASFFTITLSIYHLFSTDGSLIMKDLLWQRTSTGNGTAEVQIPKSDRSYWIEFVGTIGDPVETIISVGAIQFEDGDCSDVAMGNEYFMFLKYILL